MAISSPAVTVRLGKRSYPIYIGNHILDQAQPLQQHIKAQQVALITDENVAPLFLPPLRKILKDYKLLTITLASGEQYKNLESAETIYKQLLENRFNRDATLIAVGGGVIGDITGFVAATYQRGVPFVQIPTTLLAQVDASVGGKTAVNHPLGKNMIGAFHQPQCVIIDIASLASLPEREYVSGIAEIIKYGIIRDSKLFQYLEQHIQDLISRSPEVLYDVIRASCLCKAAIVAKDEKEQGERALLNFGHSFAHAIETAMDYTLLHGEAVAIGMALATSVSAQLKRIDNSDAQRINNLIAATGLAIQIPKQLNYKQIIELMKIDKKISAGILKLVLVKSIGEAYQEAAPDDLILEQLLNNHRK